MWTRPRVGGLGKENARLSGLGEAPIRWIVDDCAKFVEREIRRGKTYDAIIMDPPSYGRAGGEVWKLEDNLYPFCGAVQPGAVGQAAVRVLNSYTTGLAPSVLGYILQMLVGRNSAARSHGTSWACPARKAAWRCSAAPREDGFPSKQERK